MLNELLASLRPNCVAQSEVSTSGAVEPAVNQLVGGGVDAPQEAGPPASKPPFAIRLLTARCWAGVATVRRKLDASATPARMGSCFMGCLPSAVPGPA